MYQHPSILFQIFTLLKPISNILGTCKLNYILSNCTPLYIFYQHLSRNNES